MPTSPDLRSLEDIDLAGRSPGDAQAFRVLVDRHLPGLRTYLALRAPVPDLIDEVAHDAFLFAYRNLVQFTCGNMQPWLRSIAFHILRDRLKSHARELHRRDRYEQQLRVELAMESLEHADSDHAGHLGECLEALPENVRSIVRLRYEHDHTSDEIAAKTGRTALAIRSLLVRVRHQLKHCIETRAAEAAQA